MIESDLILIGIREIELEIEDQPTQSVLAYTTSTGYSQGIANRTCVRFQFLI